MKAFKITSTFSVDGALSMVPGLFGSALLEYSVGAISLNLETLVLGKWKQQFLQS